MKKSRLIIIGLFLSIFPVFFNGQHVQAYTYKHGQNTTLDKIVAKNFTKAFSIMKDKISLYEAVGQNNHPFWWYAIDRNKIDSCGSVAMPNTIIEGGSLTCEEFLIGKGDEWSGLFPHEEIGPRREEEATAYYGKIGYTLEKVAAKKSTERSCLKAEIVSLDKGTEYSVNNICLINGIIDDTARSNMGAGDRYFDVDGYGCATFRNSTGFNILGSSSNDARFCDYNSLEDLQKLFQEQANFLKGSTSYDYNFKIESAENKGTQSDSMKKGTQSTVMKKIIGQKTVKTLSTLEVYNLYYQYINNSNNVELRCDSKYDFKSRSEEWHHVIIKNNGKIDNNCYVREKRSISYSLAAPTSNAYTIDGKKNKNRQYLFSETGKSLKDLAKAINALDLKSILSKAKDTKSTEDKKASEGQSSAEKDKDCYDAGVESMSWIICPALDNTNQAVDAIESQLRNWLQIETVGKGGIFQDEKGKNNIYTGWGIFRNIANIFLIIIFLVVIFSQLTGVGIDNYGIKKILPRLIAMAILINLSYVICQLAVDLSNILGVGLDNLMKGIGFTINGGNDPSTGFALQDIAAKLLAVVAAGGVIGGIAASSGGGVMLVVSLLLAALVASVAVLIFFVMLSARMIIVAVFVVIAPVAFALYILPNTQALFKKWWKIFEAALVVYPICGALYGASYIIKAIVRPDNMANLGFFQGMIGVVAPFLPFLILPSLLKGALAGLGALGGTLTMLGNGLKKGASSGKGAIENTKAYKGAQERAADRSAERRATRIRNRLQRANIRNGGTADNLSGLSASQRRRLFQAQTTLNERNQQRAQDDVGAFDNSEVALSRAEAARDATEYKAFQDQFADPNADLATEASTAATWYNPNDRRSQQRMRALIGAMESKGMERQIFSMLESNPGVGADRVAMDALASSNNKVLKAYGKKGSGTSYRQFMSGGGMQQYASDKGTDFLNGLDDKALSEINKYSSNSNQIMSNDLLVSAAAQINSQDAANEVEAMLNKRSGFEFSGEQLAQFNASTISRFASRGMRDVNMYNALVDASNAIASDPKLLNGLAAPKRQEINKFRASAGLPPI